MTAPIAIYTGPKAERPNTVAGLIAKRDELFRYREQLEAEHRKVTVDIDHLEGSIKLFDPRTSSDVIRNHVVRHRARKGTVKRFVLTMMREASGPLGSADITDAWCDARGLRTDDETIIVIRKRIGACLVTLRNQGLVENLNTRGKGGVWRVV